MSRMSASRTYDKQENLKKLTIHFYPEYLTFKGPSEFGNLELIDAIQKELSKDNKRYLKEQKARNKTKR